MKLGWTKGLALVVAGIMLGSVASVAAQDATPAPGAKAPSKQMRGMHKGIGHAARGGALRSESVVPSRDGEGFVTVRTDRGELTDMDGEALTITQDDGHVVVVTASQDTKFRRDGAEAALGDLQVGDHVLAMRTKTDGAFTTRGVRAISAERRAEMEQRHAACEQDPDQCPRRGRGHRGSRGEHGAGHRAPMPPDVPVVESGSPAAA